MHDTQYTGMAWEMVDPSFNASTAKYIDLSDYCLHL